MKFFTLLLLLVSHITMAQTSIYDVRYTALDSGETKMATYAGRKLLIAAISPDNLEKGGLAFLDSIQAAYPKLVVLIIPSEDFGGKRNKEILKAMKGRPGKRVAVAASSKVKKGPKTEQHPLLRWLTTGSENQHFDMDVNTDNQMYFVSESGVLYAILEKGVSRKVIDQALNQENVSR